MSFPKNRPLSSPIVTCGYLSSVILLNWVVAQVLKELNLIKCYMICLIPAKNKL